MHLEFTRLGGHVAAFGLQLVRYTSERRLYEIIRWLEAAGCPVADPHTYILEDGGMKTVDEAQLAFKRQTDPLGLLNPGKMKAWTLLSVPLPCQGKRPGEGESTCVAPSPNLSPWRGRGV